MIGVAGLLRARWIVTAFLIGACGARLAFGACNSIPSQLTQLRVSGLYGPHDRILLQRDEAGRKLRQKASLAFLTDQTGVLTVEGAQSYVVQVTGRTPPFEIGDLRLLEQIRDRARIEGTPIALPAGPASGHTLPLRIAFVVHTPWFTPLRQGDAPQ
jgi:hypothetical protein